ncbi:MAG: flippase [Thermoplasmata archaeon]|nr:flippase [Thermoplasmata archaeon]
MDAPVRSTRDGLTSVTWGTLLMLLGTLGFVAQGFVSRVLLVRTLSPVEWGEFSLGLALAGLLSSIGTLGLPQAIARSLPFAHSASEERAIVRTSLGVTALAAVLLSSGLFLFGLYVAVAYAAPGLALTIELFAVSVGVSIIASILASSFQGFEDVLPNALFLQVINPGLFIVFLLAAIRLAPKSQLFVACLVSYPSAAAVTLGALALYARLRLRGHLARGPPEPAVLHRLYALAAPLFLVSVTGFITGNADTLILGVYHQATVGYYTAGLSLARLVLVGVGALSYIYLPVAARFVRSGDTGAIRMTYVTATKWMVLVSLPLFIVFFFLPGPSLGLVYGASYAGTTLPLQVLVVGAFLATLAGPAGATQVSLGQARLLLANNVATGATNLLLSLLLIPPMGVLGAAIAWSVSNAVNPVLSVIELALLEGVHPLQSHYVLPVAGTLLPFIVLFRLVPFAPPFWLLPGVVLVVAGAFLVAILLSGSVDRGDEIVLEVVEGMLGRPLLTVRRIGRWRMRHRLLAAPPQP